MFRVSFSILDPLSKGRIDEAVNRYLKIEIEPSQAMIEGKLLHEQWQAEVNETKCLPKVFGGLQLKKPETELKITMVIDGWIEFVGVIDLIDQNTIYEYKTGRSGINSYANSWQPKCYQALAEANGFKVNEAFIYYFNQHKQQVSKGKIYLTEKTKEDAIEWIRTYASELHEALENYDKLAGNQLTDELVYER